MRIGEDLICAGRCVVPGVAINLPMRSGLPSRAMVLVQQYGVNFITDSIAFVLALVALTYWLLILFGGTFTQFVGLLVLAVPVGFYLGYKTSGTSTPHSRIPNSITLVALLLVAMGAVFITLISHRPDDDDRYYLSLSFMLLENQDVALSSLKKLHSGYALLSYPAMLAGISRLSGMPLLIVYYLLGPSIFAGASVFAAYRFFSQLDEDRTFIATVVWVIVILLWGDVHRSPGNFAFVRLFQGKAIFCLFVVPLLLTYVIVYLRERNLEIALLIAATIAAGIGVTQSAVVLNVAFLVMAVGFIMPLSKALQDYSLALHGNISFYHLLPTLIILGLSFSLIVVVNQKSPNLLEASGSSPIAYTLGSNFRSWIALACLLMLPFLVGPDLRKPFAVFVLIGMAAILIPWTAWFTATIPPSISWRVVWLLPFSQATALAMSKLWSKESGTGVLVVASVVAMFGLLGPTTLNATNGVRLHWPSYKTEKADRVSLKGYGEFPIVNGLICKPRKVFKHRCEWDRRASGVGCY